MYIKVWLVFHDEVFLWWQRFLKPGFRHCSAIIQAHDTYVIINSGLNYLKCIPAPDLRYMDGGLITGPYTIKETMKPAPYSFLTCVEVCKRLLGIQKKSIVTPYQLYKFIETEHDGRTSKETKAKTITCTCSSSGCTSTSCRENSEYLKDT